MLLVNRPHFKGSFKSIKLNDCFLLYLFNSFSVFNIFLPLCCLSFVFTYLWSVSYSVSVSVFLSLPFVFLWGCGWKPSLFYFFFRGRWIFQFCISLSLFCAPSFFQAPLMCLWIRYHSVWMSSQTWMREHSHALSHTHTLCLFILETRDIHMQVCILVCLSVFSTHCSTHITAHTILKYSAYMKRIFA